ncbi:uncharacterized protein LOC119084741 [Bradysia coprophila]|uniref:uncharacterized protein LOC119084741 n=1 Tax=Bradysia coprophila TaxID=38358 RepID=UPI00187DC64B|nr:uncharacterized protein LOC119084741 [Bradysia coprophila]
MLTLKFQLLVAVSLWLLVFTHAEKPPCDQLDSKYHPHECRPSCPTADPRKTRKGDKVIENVTDKGTCEDGLKCCVLWYYDDFVGDLVMVDSLEKRQIEPW